MTNNKLKKDKIKLLKMASGDMYLLLTEEVGWYEFPEFFNHVSNILKAKIKDKYESVESAIWEIEIGKEIFRLAFDDFPQQITLEPTSADGNKKIFEIFEKVKGSGS